jgi:hypothetical protein
VDTPHKCNTVHRHTLNPARPTTSRHHGRGLPHHKAQSIVSSARRGPVIRCDVASGQEQAAKRPFPGLASPSGGKADTTRWNLPMAPVPLTVAMECTRPQNYAHPSRASATVELRHHSTAQESKHAQSGVRNLSLVSRSIVSPDPLQ